MAPSLLVAPGRPFVHLFIPSRRPRQEIYSTSFASLFLLTVLRRVGHSYRSIFATAAKHGPGDASKFIGERDR